MQFQHLAVVMPAYNEAEGLASFIEEIVQHVTPLAGTVSVVVVNDRSTDGTADALAQLQATTPALHIVNSEVNRGHGPTALDAYRNGLALQPDAVVHVDGDGQFLGQDFPRVIAALGAADVVHGVRQERSDPWFRKVLTVSVGLAVATVSRHYIPDVNTPLRAYRASALQGLLETCPADALVPHVHFSLNERRAGLTVRYVRVRSIPRRGSAETGTMWGALEKKPKLPPRRLLSFARAAAAEVWRYSLRPGRAKVPAPTVEHP